MTFSELARKLSFHREKEKLIAAKQKEIIDLLELRTPGSLVPIELIAAHRNKLARSPINPSSTPEELHERTISINARLLGLPKDTSLNSSRYAMYYARAIAHLKQALTYSGQIIRTNEEKDWVVLPMAEFRKHTEFMARIEQGLSPHLSYYPHKERLNATISEVSHALGLAPDYRSLWDVVETNLHNNPRLISSIKLSAA